HMTGYAWFISQCLRPNPGIYLPLQGGTMQGNIDMAKHRLLKLPLPTVNQEAASKKYVDDLAPGLHAATHESGGADEIDLAGLLGLLADDQHVLDAEVLAVAEAIGVAADLIGVHAGLPAAHHARYVDAEAQAVADARILIHKGITAAHHARYTDGEAVTAAKAVKLDDFATPDDNVHLNASTTRHGLFKKLDDVINHFLNGKGNWVEVTGEAATKEFFIPIQSETAYKGNFPTVLTSGKHAFKVPHDFSSIVSVEAICVNDATEELDVSASSDYAAVGEARTTHSESNNNLTTSFTANQLTAIDLSSILSNLSADDY
ncbi:unnamed protein product, partial [marine sediment metagenome]